ncbi:putative DNA-binding protein [Encephalitozoon cuniculi]|nr:putative DNA-binding protein [Encephalitozoon cuniculi]
MHVFRSKEEAVSHLRTKFTDAHEVRELMKRYNISMKRGCYNSYEGKVIDEAIRRFLKEHRLEMRNLHAFFLEEEPEFPIKDLLVEVSNALEQRTMNSVWVYVSYHYHPYIDAKWEPENEIQLLNLVRVLGFKWKEICGIMNKTSRKCISNYYRIMGFRYLYRKSFKMPEGGIPTTNEEWDRLCESLRTTRKRLSHLINGYISSKLVVPFWNEYNNMALMGYVILHNHFCSVDIKVSEILRVIDQGSAETSGGEGVSRERIHEEISRFIPDLGSYKLDIPIDAEDIFWRTIRLFVQFPSALLRSRFIQITKVYGIRTFKDLIEVFRNLAVDCYLYKVKDRLKDEVNKILIQKSTRRRSTKELVEGDYGSKAERSCR